VQKNEYGTLYVNRENERSIVVKGGNGKWKVIHGEKEVIEFDTFEEAERFVKRRYASSLQFDNDLFKQMGQIFKVKEDELKNNYVDWIKKHINEMTTA
jgi:hypothetical protein